MSLNVNVFNVPIGNERLWFSEAIFPQQVMETRDNNGLKKQVFVVKNLKGTLDGYIHDTLEQVLRDRSLFNRFGYISRDCAIPQHAAVHLFRPYLVLHSPMHGKLIVCPDEDGVKRFRLVIADTTGNCVFSMLSLRM